MKTRTFFLLLPILTLIFTAATLRQQYQLTNDFTIQAVTKGVEANFSDLQGTVVFDANDLNAARFDVSVATASIATGNKTQDKHARSDNWLNAEAHPRIRFVSSRVELASSGDAAYLVTGDFTINGQTHRETFPFAFDGRTFKGSITLNRERYGIEGPFLFGGLVGDEVAVTLRVGVE